MNIKQGFEAYLPTQIFKKEWTQDMRVPMLSMREALDTHLTALSKWAETQGATQECVGLQQ